MSIFYQCWIPGSKALPCTAGYLAIIGSLIVLPTWLTPLNLKRPVVCVLSLTHRSGYIIPCLLPVSPLGTHHNWPESLCINLLRSPLSGAWDGRNPHTCIFPHSRASTTPWKGYILRTWLPVAVYKYKQPYLWEGVGLYFDFFSLWIYAVSTLITGIPSWL